MTDVKELVEQLRAAYDAWNSPPSEGLPTYAGLVLEAADALEAQAKVINPQASKTQVDEMRMAFFAGAQHVYASILTMLDPGEDPTKADLSRMDALRREMEEFVSAYTARELRSAKPEGSA